jgi:hypothetical protein
MGSQPSPANRSPGPPGAPCCAGPANLPPRGPCFPGPGGFDWGVLSEPVCEAPGPSAAAGAGGFCACAKATVPINARIITRVLIKCSLIPSFSRRRAGRLSGSGSGPSNPRRASSFIERLSAHRGD